MHVSLKMTYKHTSRKIFLAALPKILLELYPRHQIQRCYVGINIQYTYIVGKYIIYLYELQKQIEKRAFGELFYTVSHRVQINFIFNDNERILCLSCNVKKVGRLVRFKQKGQKQASFLAFHKCCQGCLLRGPRKLVPVSYVSAPSAVHSYRVPGKFIRRLKSLFVQYE